MPTMTKMTTLLIVIPKIYYWRYSFSSDGKIGWCLSGLMICVMVKHLSCNFFAPEGTGVPIIKTGGLGYGPFLCGGWVTGWVPLVNAICKLVLPGVWCQMHHPKFPVGGTFGVTSLSMSPAQNPAPIKGSVWVGTLLFSQVWLRSPEFP